MVGTPKLDRIDISILSTLQQQGNITNVNLAEAVGLSPSPCLQRVKRLEKAGYIQNYRAVINLKKLAEHVTVFTEVTLADHRRKDFVKFENEIKNHENVVECHLLSGGYDYLLKFVARGVTQYQVKKPEDEAEYQKKAALRCPHVDTVHQEMRCTD